MTKAERIFKDTRYDCWVHVKNWGYDGSGFNSLSDRKDEAVCTRTLNDIERIWDREVRRVRTSYRLGVIDKDTAMLDADVLKMVKVTIDNERKKLSK